MNQQISKPIIMYSAAWCGDCKRVKRFLDSQRVPYIVIDIEQDAVALALVECLNHGRRIIPTLLFPDGSLLVEPSNAELAAKLRL